MIKEKELFSALLRDRLAAAQNHVKLQANQHRMDIEYTEGARCYLNSSHMPSLLWLTVPAPSLRISTSDCIGRAAYQLDLPEGSQIHPVFLSHLSAEILYSWFLSSVLQFA